MRKSEEINVFNQTFSVLGQISIKYNLLIKLNNIIYKKSNSVERNKNWNIY